MDRYGRRAARAPPWLSRGPISGCAANALDTADAILLPPSDPEVAGRDKIRAHYAGAFGRFALKISATALEIRTAADWGVVRGTPKPLHDKFLGIVERGADGQWRFARLMWSPVAKPG